MSSATAIVPASSRALAPGRVYSSSSLSFGHLIRRRPVHRLRALRALTRASTHGCTGAPDLPHQRFVRAADRAASVATPTLDLVASLAARSRAPFSYMNGLCGRARLLTPRFVPSRSIAASAIAPSDCPCPSFPRHARWGLTQRSTGRAGTRLDPRRASRRRAGYLAR
jgi:hypothetical protein